MALVGQASGDWTESSSSLRILYAGTRNSLGVLTADSFTQDNPSAVRTAGTITSRVDTTVHGVLSGSVCFARPDAGNNLIGGAGSDATQLAIQANAGQVIGFRPLGVFINNANGNPYENLPGQASGKGPYMSGQGSYGNRLFEEFLIATVNGNAAAGTAISYTVGQQLVASRNGFLMPSEIIDGTGALVSADLQALTAESFVRAADGSATVIGVLKHTPDATLGEIVYDQSI